MNNSIIEISFTSKECKKRNHFLCSKKWEGFGFNIICTCDCHKEIDGKNIVLDGHGNSSNTHCRNDIFNRTAETGDEI